MTQAANLAQIVAEYKSQPLKPSDALRLQYAENLLHISQQQSPQACTESLAKAAQLLAIKPASITCNTINTNSYQPLLELNHYLNQSLPELRKSQQSFSFQEQLQNSPAQNSQNAGFADLQSKRAFLSMQQTLFAEHIVNDAIAQGPENPGPLNPQQLAINALKNMRDLSPAYLTRYVSFVDSLFALEKIDKPLKK